VSCPTREEYAGLLDNQIYADRADRLEVHLERCAACERVLDELTGELDPSALLLIRSILAHEEGKSNPRAEPPGDPHGPSGVFVERLRSHEAMRSMLHERSPDDDTTDGAAARPREPWPRLPGLEIITEVGRGGTGVVYKARQVDTDRIVAVKVLGIAAADPRRQSRARRGAQILARLEHPNVTRLYGLGFEGGIYYGILEYLEAGSLDGLLRGLPWPPDQAANLIHTLARATGFVHQQGIVHLDLKPANILMTADGVPKIADFGLARLIDDAGELSQSGEIVGTPSYMAPEQAAGRRSAIGPATDVHGLGSILYHLLTGRPPFRGQSVQQWIQQVLYMPPVPPSRFHPGIPRHLEAVCLKCLRKEPTRRYQNAGTLAESLRKLLPSLTS
jgi:serine/threonine protein kinase